jgi:ATP-binding cassette subfamily B protein
MSLFGIDKIFLIKYKKCKANFVLNIVIGIVLGIIPIILIKVKQVIIDEGLKISDFKTINTALIFICFYVFLYVLQHVGDIVITKFTNELKLFLDKTLKKITVEKISRLSYELIENKEILDLIKLVDNVSGRVLKNFNNCRLLILCSIQLIGTLVIILLIDYKVLIGILIFLLAGIVCNIKQSKSTFGFWQNYIKRTKKSNYISSILINREYVLEKKLFNYNFEMNEKFENEFEKAKKENSKYGFKRFILQFTFEALSTIYMISIFLLFVPPLINSKISIGLYIAISFAVVDLLNCSKKIFDIIFEYEESKEYMKEWTKFLNLKETEGIDDEILTKLDFQSIEFRDVYFSYPESKELTLQGVTFKIDKGVHYSLVGENGSGKSTIIKLILGLYKPTKGTIFIDGIDINKIRQNEINSYFSVVFQDFAKYPFTIKENICIGDIKNINNEDKILRVTNYLGLKEKIDNLPKKLDTNLMNIKQDGIDLSGGQWQKIAVCRVLISEKPILILDEPNASLDPLSEVELYDTYRKILKEKTTIFISHRLGSIKLADKILVLRNGKIVENGTHNELMANTNYYHDLFMKQRSFYE